MKKTLLLLTSVALLLVGCAKEQIVDLQEGELTNVTFTANVENGVATKAVADGDGAAASVNRCIMEIYYGDTFYKRLVQPVSDKVATFANVPVVAGKQYTVLFWADCGNGDKTDKYYTTNGPDSLKAVTVKKDAFVNALQSKKNDELDAFFFAGNYTVSQNQAGSYTVTLKRPFAQLNVITTDVAAGKTVINADLLPEKVSVSYTAADTCNVADSTVTGSTIYEYEAPVYGEKTNWETVKARGEFTLSMDYILASKDQRLVNVTFKTLNGTTEVMTHNLTNLPYQRNYRTNVKGDLLTVGGTWKAEIEPKWGNGTDTGEIDHQIATSYTEVKTALQSGDKSDNLKVTVTPAAVNNLSVAEKSQVIVNETIGEEEVQALRFILYEEKTTGEDIHHASPKHVEFELPARPEGVQAWKIEYEPEYPTETVVVSTPPEDTDPTIIIEAPKSTVTLDATKINSVVSTTSENTLIIPQGLDLKNLTVKKGAVEYHGTGLTMVKVEATGTDTVYFKTSEGLANTDDVYGVVKNHIAPGFAITKEPETTWKIVPEVCKIDKTGYASLSDAVAAAPESSETTIKMVNDVDYGDIAGDGAVVIPSGKVIILDLNGKKISASRTVKTNTSIIANDGKLTIIDNAGTGEIYMNSTVDDSGWSSSVSAITNRATLIVNSGHIHTDGAAGMSYAIDSRQNGYSFDVVATINGGLIEAPNYRAIRLFANGTNGADNLVVTGGEIVGKTAGIWQQDANAHKNKSSVTISGGKITATDESRHALYIDGNTDTEGLSATITGGQFKSPAFCVFVENCTNVSKFISGGIFSNQPDEALIADKFELTENTDAATKDQYPWTIAPGSEYVAQIGSELYTSVQEAFKASKDNETIVLLKDTNRGSDQYTSSYGNNVTFDLNGHKIESNNNQGVFHFNGNEKNISFIDSKGNGGLVQLDCNPSSDQYSAICAEGANVNIYSGHYETKVSDHDWTQVLYAKGSNITVYGGTFIGDLITNNQIQHLFPEWGYPLCTIEIFGGVFTGKVLDSWNEDGVKSEVVIHGGKFSFNPTDYLAQGEKLVAEQGEDGYWTVSVEKIRAVDLGLSVEWGDRNVGASDMFGHGDYFAWGETVARAAGGDWDSYKWYDKSSNTITKYNTTDQVYVLAPEDDAASANIGGGWRMPTKAEMEELFNNCTKEKVSNYEDSGINGLLFTAQNGQTLFIPTSGNIWDQLYNPTTEVSCWCADKPTNGSAKAYALDYISSLIDKDTGFSRCGLMPIRPVRSK